MKLVKKQITFETETKIINIFVNPFTTEKNKAMRGFADISILKKEGDKKVMLYQWNSNSVIETKDGEVFLAAPQQKAYKNADGELTSNGYFFIPRDIREDAVKRILEEASENTNVYNK